MSLSSGEGAGKSRAGEQLSVTVVIGTIENSGREARLREVVDELKRQERVSLQIVGVFQTNNGASPPQIDGVEWEVTDMCGSSEARNRGAARALNALVCFLDDDTYPVGDDFFVRVWDLLETRGWDFLTCNIRTSGDVQAGGSISNDVEFDRKTIRGNMWEPGLTLRKAAIDAVSFDPTLGIGCIHGSSEGVDFGLRLLADGRKGGRIASLLVDHPPLPLDDGTNVERAFFYSLGNGAVLIQHGYYYQYIRTLVRTFARLIVSIVRGRRPKIKSSFIRLACLCIGPLLPRRPARLLPPKRNPLQQTVDGN